MNKLWKRICHTSLAVLCLGALPACGNHTTPISDTDRTFDNSVLFEEDNNFSASSTYSDYAEEGPTIEEGPADDTSAVSSPLDAAPASKPERPASRDWGALFAFPSPEEITTYQSQSTHRSPYIAGWPLISADTHYTEYVVDFKADYLPNGTYCCLGNWSLDYSSLLQQYQSYRTEYEGVSGYAGFQSLDDGSRVSIMSFWDVYCTTPDGSMTTIRAQRVYPDATYQSDSFDGEGTGAHCIVPYDWQAGYWYQMHLKCVTSESTGNTVIEQWVYDYARDESTLLCSYDLGVPNVCFKGANAFFLENFCEQFSGEVRTMEVRNPAYLDADTLQWYTVTSADMHSEGGLPQYEGSYNFGADSECFWMITSGVGGDWYGNGQGKHEGNYSIG